MYGGGGGGGPSRPPGIVHPQEKAETIAKEIAKAAEAARKEHARQEQMRLEFMQEVARQQEYARQQELRRQEEQELRRQEEHKRRQEEKRQEELRQEEHKRRQEEERQKARQAAKQAELAKAKEQLRAQEKSLMAAKLAEATRVAEAARLAKQKEEAAKQAALARLKAKEAKAAKAKATADAKAKAAAIREAKAKIAEAEAAAAARPGGKRKAEFPEPPFESGGASLPSVTSAASAIDEENEVWTKQADIECTEIINVTEHSPEHVWTRMLAEVKAATFVAVDTEFSGIGSMRTTRDKDMEVRYTAMRSAVQSHGLLQLGLSIWRRIDRETTGSAAYDTARYFVTSYCIPVLPSEDFSVTPSSLQFLAEAGIDLSQLCRDGVRFKKPVRAVRGTASANASSPMGERYLRELMAVCYTRPFVTHNGLLDLMFLYEAFTGPLPKKLGQFIAEGIKLYRGQLLDTKCIAEYSQRPAWSPSYLELLYARARRLCTAAAAETPVQAHLKFLAKAKKSNTNTPKGSHRGDGSSNSPRKPDESNSTVAASVADSGDNSASDGSAKRRRLSDDDQDSTPAATAQQGCQVCANYACVIYLACWSAAANRRRGAYSWLVG